MTIRLIVMAIMIAATGTRPGASLQDSTRVALESARKTEVVDGDLRSAIEQYKTIAAGADRTLAAQALFWMAGVYRKLGSAEAEAVYARIVRDFHDVSEIAAQARDRLGSSTVQDGPAMTLRKIWDGDISGTVSRDGRRLSYNDWGRGHVGVRDLVTGTSRPITASDHSAFASAISKDGTLVAYTWVNPSKGVELRLASADGKDLSKSRPILTGEDIDWIRPLDWAPDGRTIAVSVARRDRSALIGLVQVPEGRLIVLKSTDWRGPTRAFFSPDGQYLGFDLTASGSAGQRDVFILAVNGSREIPAVTHPAQDIMMGWAPDGTQLLFASDRRDGTMGLWGQPLNQGRPSAAAYSIKSSIGTGLSLGVTDDGSLYLAMPAGDGDVASVMLDIETGRPIEPVVRPAQSFLGSNTQPQWSPDGQSLAYAAARGFNASRNLDQRVIVIQDLTSGQIREVRPQLSYFNQFNWSPDGRAFVTGGKDMKGRSGIYRIDVQTSETTLLADSDEAGDAYPRWSPDGSRIYYHRAGIVERDLGTGRERQVVKDGTVALGPINLSPDGRWIVMGAANPDGATAGRLILIPVAGGEIRQILSIDAPDRFANFQGMPWLPDGRGFLVRKRTAKSSEIWFVPLSGSARKLDVDASQWSNGPIGALSLHPDGRRLAFLLASSRPVSEVWKLERFLTATGR